MREVFMKKNIRKIKKEIISYFKKYRIWSIIVLVIILLGFIVSADKYEYDRGYNVSFNNAITRRTGIRVNDVELGDRSITKYSGWYFIPLYYQCTYYEGDLKLSEEFINDNNGLFQDDYHEKEYYIIGILALIPIWIFLFLIPIIVKKIKQKYGNTSENKKLKELKKLNELKENNIIDEEEYQKRKKTLLNKKSKY